ncbi:hypothetical protein B0T24DRAFT_646562 [Lasiosphaeria ovina]|uniref:Uncharacterized protein n=1 Tax=Lasiosphaeria ovina TaxID=92902 RepID=A0AAE0KL81_9PEZI|nr:hypothetical protein B0T24DRAFT_646562 [Lasiosphaeria ovina]
MTPHNGDEIPIVPSSSSWKSLVSRSIQAWTSLVRDPGVLHQGILQRFNTLDEFLSDGSGFMFWFFQRREAFLSQKTLAKWSPDRLDDYMLLPAASGFVKRTDCFFISHFWHTKDDPDPDGHFLRLFQQCLGPQTWSYVWVDWTCAPQHPRSPPEELYFLRTLNSMSGIIRNSGFMWFYPPFEPRLWILYEIAEYTLTCEGGMQEVTPDNEQFIGHVQEMVRSGVRATLDRHGYRCTFDRDKQFLMCWLEVIVLMKDLHLHIDDVRNVLDNLTWHPVATIYRNAIDGRLIQLDRYEGTLILGEESHSFTPFPDWRLDAMNTRRSPGVTSETEKAKK